MEYLIIQSLFHWTVELPSSCIQLLKACKIMDRFEMFRNWKLVIGLLPWPIRNCQLRNTPDHFSQSSTSSKFFITNLDSLFDSLEKTSESDDEWQMSFFKTIKMLSKWFSKRCNIFQKQSIKFQNRPELVSDGLDSFYHLIFFNRQRRTLFLTLNPLANHG